jgi:hypothetical protein
MIKSYFDKVRNKIKEMSPLIKTESISFDMISAVMGIVKGRIVFLDGSMLDFKEIISSRDHDYRFHWMDSKNKLIVRWDTAPHHKNLDNFPFHKHDTRSVVSSEELNLAEVMEDIKKALIHKLYSN